VHNQPLVPTAHPLSRVDTRAGAARFSRWLDMTTTAKCFAALTQSNAMQRPEDANERRSECAVR
jgi:hypothetical protein